MSEPVYKRILLKISGEALAGEKKVGIDDATDLRADQESSRSRS